MPPTLNERREGKREKEEGKGINSDKRPSKRKKTEAHPHMYPISSVQRLNIRPSDPER